MSRRVFILGSTGSIGCNAIKVIQHLRQIDGGESWPVIGLSADKNINLIVEQAAILNTSAIALSSGSTEGIHAVYPSSDEMLCELAKKGDLVVVAIVGFAGISSVLTAIQCGCDVALANKESLVAGGSLVMESARKAGVKLIPIDSEHSAIFQALSKHPNKEVKTILLTASGGSLRHVPTVQLQDVTVEQVLRHPTWKMGPKVTVDSASLMNKALELVEAHWLFNVGRDKLKALIHPQSVVHSMVEFIDGSVIAQLSPPDMKIPIQYALTWPRRFEGCSESINWSESLNFEFEPIDIERYPSIGLAYHVIDSGGTAGAVFNAANEVVVEAFLRHALPFCSMVGIVSEVLESVSLLSTYDYEVLCEVDNEARQRAKALVSTQVYS